MALNDKKNEIIKGGIPPQPRKIYHNFSTLKKAKKAMTTIVNQMQNEMIPIDKGGRLMYAINLIIGVLKHEDEMRFKEMKFKKQNEIEQKIDRVLESLGK